MGIVAGLMIAVINQLMLCWKIRRLENKEITDPKQVVNAGRISLIERLALIGILLTLAMKEFDPPIVLLSFFIINLSLVYFIKCQAKH